MGKNRRQYTKEFKIEAVRLIVEEGRPISEVARELGIGENLLHRWKKKSEEGKIDPFPGQGRLSPEDEELRRLRRENERLRMEHEILKKAVAIFSEEPHGMPEEILEKVDVAIQTFTRDAPQFDDMTFLVFKVL